MAKAGSTPLSGVYDYAEPVTARGLTFMNSPGYDPVSVTGQVAGGCNLVLFTTGRGSVFGFKPAPCLKISTTSALYERMADDIDFDAGRVLAGADMAGLAAELLDLTIAVASGRPSKSEAQGVGEAEFCPVGPGGDPIGHERPCLNRCRPTAAPAGRRAQIRSATRSAACGPAAASTASGPRSRPSSSTRPAPSWQTVADPDQVQMLDRLDAGRARAQHDALAQAYRDAGVTVHYVEPDRLPPPNLIFVADLLFMTPEGAIVGRPASTVRAGEERFVARRLAELGIPILRTVRGSGTFEGADAAWIDPHTVLLATGLRTNAEGAAQVAGLLGEMGIEVIHVGLPYGAMHLMGTLRFAGPDLAVAWPGRVPYAAVEALRARGYTVLFSPADDEVRRRMALNFVTLGPRRILMAAGSPLSQRLLRGRRHRLPHRRRGRAGQGGGRHRLPDRHPGARAGLTKDRTEPNTLRSVSQVRLKGLRDRRAGDIILRTAETQYRLR